MSLVKQPGVVGVPDRGEVEQSRMGGAVGLTHMDASAPRLTHHMDANAPTSSAPGGSRAAVSAAVTASPPVSPSNAGLGPEDPEGMGLEMDESGRRMSQRRRRPNMRIHDELEPSEREKAWGKGRGRRSKTAAAPPVPAPPTNGVRPRTLLLQSSHPLVSSG